VTAASATDDQDPFGMLSRLSHGRQTRVHVPVTVSGQSGRRWPREI